MRRVLAIACIVFALGMIGAAVFDIIRYGALVLEPRAERQHLPLLSSLGFLAMLGAILWLGIINLRDEWMD